MNKQATRHEFPITRRPAANFRPCVGPLWKYVTLKIPRPNTCTDILLLCLPHPNSIIIKPYSSSDELFEFVYFRARNLIKFYCLSRLSRGGWKNYFGINFSRYSTLAPSFNIIHARPHLCYANSRPRSRAHCFFTDLKLKRGGIILSRAACAFFIIIKKLLPARHHVVVKRCTAAFVISQQLPHTGNRRDSLIFQRGVVTFSPFSLSRDSLILIYSKALPGKAPPECKWARLKFIFRIH